MTITGRIAKALLLLPLAEVVIFVLVAIAIGFWRAFALSLLTSLAGAVVLKLAGRTHVRQFGSSLAEGIELTGDDAGRSLSQVLAGFLLLIPGFITDAAALLILLPATRRWLGSFIGASLTDVIRRKSGEPGVVDLDPDQWRRHNERQPPDSGGDAPRSLPQAPRR